MTDSDEWLANANEAFTISLVKHAADGFKTVGTFNPRFTYPIFGDEEHIFGYKDLKINLRYNASDMRPHVQISSSKKSKAVGDIEPVDVKGILQEHLPPIAFSSGSDFKSSARKQPPNWQPPGAPHDSFEAADGTYEIRKGSLADAAIRQLINRIEILVPLFIEGGSYIGREQHSEEPWKGPEDAARWTVFLLYQKQPAVGATGSPSYTFVGYSTVYKFFPFQAPTPPASPAADWELPKGEFDLDRLPCRSRLSQFIILPPFQGRGIGARLYNSIFEHYLRSPQTVELTVEDPNEAFDDMRDLADLTYLRTVPEFSQVHINTSVALPRDPTSIVPRAIIDMTLLDKLRRETKIAPRQFARLIEMHTMSQLPESVQPRLGVEKAPSPTKADKHQYHLWQLFVKKRIYRQNKDVLGQVEPPERLEKLSEALRSVELEYARLLAAHGRWQKHYASTADYSTSGKRKLAEETEQQGVSKKARVDSSSS
ncbi:histone acetyltransferase type B catalytic subunit [Sodiomyces alkalinus F11]|uniref:Histone acetyltransferase type B catalytic subunit n=1 Tax=Sodiomyces alkalinus (strain CBS 110278 / VKM F-3762 / F11) TaxID=1314773 RepID=A0A3N2PWB3_SODAK|nr:histone acetyltransferase type B catalytic subunit [Sodiomyces alkalinus F11]ROT38780.1 histone acetyltransferase type B catalytic subunit [Sodiomyces alkalinus F11]